MNPIEITIDDAELRQLLDRLGRAGLNLGPLMKTLAATLQDQTEARFEAEGPGWPELAETTKTARAKLGHWPGKRLQVSGQLAGSILTESGADFARIGSSKEYAAIHQLGGKTRAHRIVPVHKKALAFGGVVRRSVNHPGSEIKARPYLPMTADGQLTPEAKQAVLEEAFQYLRRAALGGGV